MKKSIFDLTRKEGVQVDKELRKTSYYKQYVLGYLYVVLMLLLLGVILPSIGSDIENVTLSTDTELILFSVTIGFASLLSLLFYFKRFDLVKKYYEEKCNKEEK